MHNIHPVNPPVAPGAVDPTKAVTGNKPPPEPTRICDTVDISTIAKLAVKAQELPDVRTELVAQVKAEIATGTYESTERIEGAIDRLMEELSGGL